MLFSDRRGRREIYVVPIMRLLLPCRCRRAQRSRRRGDAKKKAEGVQATSATLDLVKAACSEKSAELRRARRRRRGTGSKIVPATTAKSSNSP